MGAEGLFAQTAEKVLRITREIRSYEWYETQSKLWKTKVDRNVNDSEAWINYYEANRAAGIVNRGKRPVDLNDIISELKQKAGNSFAYHFLIYRNTGWQEKLFPHLEKAWKIDDSYPQLAEEFVSYYEFQYDLKNRRIYNQHWFNTGEMPGDLLAYNYNVLMSLEKNAILITNGDNDTYPVWMLQDVQDVRRDVIVINRSLALLPDYLNRVLETNNIKAFQVQKTAEDYEVSNLNQLINHLKSNSSRPIYFANTVAPDALNEHKKNLYMTGLASKYSESRFDNIKIMARHYEKDFLLDYLKVNFEAYSPYSTVKRMNQAYMTPFLSLHRYYQEKGQNTKAGTLKELILTIAKGTDYESDIINSLK